MLLQPLITGQDEQFDTEETRPLAMKKMKAKIPQGLKMFKDVQKMGRQK